MGPTAFVYRDRYCTTYGIVFAALSDCAAALFSEEDLMMEKQQGYRCQLSHLPEQIAA